jgi:RNA polymerase sigma-70 factor (ECF subfamily)
MSPGPGPQTSENELIRLATEAPGSQQGREAAAELLRRHQRKVYLWCFRMVREHELALDLAQEVLMQAYEALPGFEGRSGFGSWLFTITRNCCLMHLRRPSLLGEDESDPDQLPDAEPDPARRLQEDEDEQRLLHLINTTLDEDERTALWLRCFDRVPVDEITHLLDLESASGARALLQRARRKLRRVLPGPNRESEES